MAVIQDIILGFSWDVMIKTVFRITVILGFAWFAMKLLKHFTHRLEKQLIDKSENEGETPSESQKRVETIIRLLRQGALIALWVTVALVILKDLGVAIAPILASAGILGLAVGFGAQNLVRDIISGFFIILENQIRIGDVAVINGTGGLVEKINFRTIVLRDLGGVVHIFPNGTVATISNLTKDWSAYIFDIGVAYKENIDRVIEIMKQVGEKMMADHKFGRFMLEQPDVFGVDKFDDSAVIIKGRIKTKPIKQWEVGREFLRRLKYAFDEKNIEIPFPHQTVYFGEESKPFNLKILQKFLQREPATI